MLINNDSTKNYIKQIIFLATPIIFENIFQTLLGTVDTYFAGQLHDNAIAAIGVTNLIVNIFIAFFTAISVGTSTVISRFVGQKNFNKANLAVKQSIIIGTGLGVIVGFISFVFRNQILRISGATDQVISYAIPYFIIVAVPSILICLTLILSSCLRASKDTKSPMMATGISNVINIVLNYVFIKLGFGIVGLALATTTSRLIVVIILFKKLNKGKSIIKLELKNFNINKDIMNSIIRIGIPAGIEKLIMRFGQLVYNGMIISLGTAAYVAHNVGGTIENYTYIPAFGFAMATATLVGISLGENSPRKAKQITFTTYIITAICMICIGIGFYVFAPFLATLFTKTPEVQGMVVSILRLIAFFQPFSALTQVMTSALQGAGDTKFPMYATLIGIWGIRVGVGYLFAVVLNYGLFGVWCAYALDITIRGTLLLIRFLNGKWQSIKI